MWLMCLIKSLQVVGILHCASFLGVLPRNRNWSTKFPPPFAAFWMRFLPKNITTMIKRRNPFSTQTIFIFFVDMLWHSELDRFGNKREDGFTKYVRLVLGTWFSVFSFCWRPWCSQLGNCSLLCVPGSNFRLYNYVEIGLVYWTGPRAFIHFLKVLSLHRWQKFSVTSELSRNWRFHWNLVCREENIFGIVVLSCVYFDERFYPGESSEFVKWVHTQGRHLVAAQRTTDPLYIGMLSLCWVDSAEKLFLSDKQIQFPFTIKWDSSRIEESAAITFRVVVKKTRSLPKAMIFFSFLVWHCVQRCSFKQNFQISVDCWLPCYLFCQLVLPDLSFPQNPPPPTKYFCFHQRLLLLYPPWRIRWCDNSLLLFLKGGMVQ